MCLFLSPLWREAGRLQDHGMVSTVGLGSGFPTSIWPKQKKKKQHCVSGSLRQGETAALRLSWGRWRWRWWWCRRWRGVHVRQGRAWRNPSRERDTGRDWRSGERGRAAASPARAPPAALPHSIWRRANTRSGRARGADRACRSAPAGHSDRNLLP